MTGAAFIGTVSSACAGHFEIKTWRPLFPLAKPAIDAAPASAACYFCQFIVNRGPSTLTKKQPNFYQSALTSAQ